MVTIVLTSCPAGLRGHLTRWLEEIAPGVFVGKVNSRLRNILWGLVIEMVGSGRAIMVYPDRNAEQGYAYKVHRHDWEVVDVEGLSLIRRPFKNRTKGDVGLKPGWSNPAKRRRARRTRRSE